MRLVEFQIAQVAISFNTESADLPAKYFIPTAVLYQYDLDGEFMIAHEDMCAG